MMKTFSLIVHSQIDLDISAMRWNFTPSICQELTILQLNLQQAFEDFLPSVRSCSIEQKRSVNVRWEYLLISILLF